MESKAALSALAALAQETRLAIFRLLVSVGPTGLAVGEIGHELGTAPATLSFHLKELARADLIAPRQDGRFIFYAANFERMNDLLGFLTENCCARDGMACAASCPSANPGQPASGPAKAKPGRTAVSRRARVR